MENSIKNLHKGEHVTYVYSEYRLQFEVRKIDSIWLTLGHAVNAYPFKLIQVNKNICSNHMNGFIFKERHGESPISKNIKESFCIYANVNKNIFSSKKKHIHLKKSIDINYSTSVIFLLFQFEFSEGNGYICLVYGSKRRRPHVLHWNMFAKLVRFVCFAWVECKPALLPHPNSRMIKWTVHPSKKKE